MVVPGGVDRSGTERVIPILLAMIERVAAEHELHVFALRQEDSPAAWPLLGATVHNAGTRRPSLRALRDVLAEHRRAPFDVLHGVWVSPGLVAGAAGRLLRRPVLLHLVGGDVAALPEIGYGLQRSRAGRLRLRAAARLASHVTANSGYAVKLAAERGIAAERVPYGVSVRDWPALAPRRREAAALGLGERVRFHGFMPQRALRPWMERADVLLVTSRHECGPMVAMEAALAGVPTVGTRVGLLAEWVPDAAVPVPTADPTALADAVAALLGEEDRRLRLADAAQRRALNDDADHAAGRVLDIYRTLTHRGDRT